MASAMRQHGAHERRPSLTIAGRRLASAGPSSGVLRDLGGGVWLRPEGHDDQGLVGDPLTDGSGFGVPTGPLRPLCARCCHRMGFWFIEATTKRHQLRYYARMRDIELAAYNLNHVTLDIVDPKHEYQITLGAVSAPRIDVYRSYPKGKLTDWRTDVPWRRTPEETQRMLRRAFWMPHVILPSRRHDRSWLTALPRRPRRPRRPRWTQPSQHLTRCWKTGPTRAPDLAAAGRGRGCR